MLTPLLNTSDFLNDWVLNNEIHHYCLKFTQSDIYDDKSYQLIKLSHAHSKLLAVEFPEEFYFEDYIYKTDYYDTWLDYCNRVASHEGHRVIVPFSTKLRDDEVSHITEISGKIEGRLRKFPNLRLYLRNAVIPNDPQRDLSYDTTAIHNIHIQYNCNAEMLCDYALDIGNVEISFDIMRRLGATYLRMPTKPYTIFDYIIQYSKASHFRNIVYISAGGLELLLKRNILQGVINLIAMKFNACDIVPLVDVNTFQNLEERLKQ